jgi:pimeloyl-ACP methyl ester carboxylesterase
MFVSVRDTQRDGEARWIIATPRGARTIVQMPRLRRPDGVEIEWRVQGKEGPLVAIALMALQPPVVSRRLVEELAPDHRLLTYDLRGTGESSRSGPYDIETDAADLGAVVDEAGGSALAIATGDGARRAVRAAAERPDLIHTVAISGEVPLGPIPTAGRSEALADSPAVLEALLELLDIDYRTGLRTMFTSSGDSEWHTMALRDRMNATEAHCPREAGVPRMRAWVRDDSSEHGRALGDRLWYLHYPGNAWFQGALAAIRRDLPAARFEAVPDGVISRPGENAAAIRRILAARRAAA